MVRVTSALFPMDSTLCIIKPDAMRLGYKQNICHMIHMFGFNVIAEATFKVTYVLLPLSASSQRLEIVSATSKYEITKELRDCYIVRKHALNSEMRQLLDYRQLTRVRAEQFYRAHAKMPYFETLIRFMISRSIHCMVLVRDNCCRAFRALLGPKDSNRARREAPQTIRALYGTDGRMNAVHGSDSVKDAEIEIKFFFPTVILEPYPTSQDAATYFKEHVQPLLLKGLTALAKSKPASETTGAVRWLAHWLHDHNPRLPLICICVEKKYDALKEEPVIEFPFY